MEVGATVGVAWGAQAPTIKLKTSILNKNLDFILMSPV
jgi:hypothetical protein